MNEPFSARTALPDVTLWRQATARRVPLSCTFEVTARCNNNCRHCYINRPAGDEAARREELSLDEIGAIADQAVALGTLWCTLTGGEPLLRPDFPEIYLALKRRGLLISLFTNACLVTDEHVSLFRRYPPRDLEVTVYGANEETYERVSRQPGSYAAFRRGLERLIQGGVNVRLKAMVVRSNWHELPAIEAFCRERTDAFFRYDPLLHLRYDGDPQRNAEIRAERLTAAEIVSLERRDPRRLEALTRVCSQATDQDVAPQRHDLFRCATGTSEFCVSYQGLFRLCSSLWHPDFLSDLRHGSLAEAWGHFVPRALARKSENPHVQEKCLRCGLIDLCLWCPAHAYLESGSLDVVCQEFCEIAHARAALSAACAV